MFQSTFSSLVQYRDLCIVSSSGDESFPHVVEPPLPQDRDKRGYRRRQAEIVPAWLTVMHDAARVTGGAPARALNKEELIGLRARLAIMEVPAELDDQWREEWGHGAHAAIDALKAQLQVLA